MNYCARNNKCIVITEIIMTIAQVWSRGDRSGRAEFQDMTCDYLMSSNGNPIWQACVEIQLELEKDISYYDAL